MAERERRKRKWDVPGDPNTITPSMQPASQYGDIQGVTADSVMAAASAAARINAQLVAKGFGTKEAVTRDITINDCKPDIRYQLTKGPTHEQLHRETGCTIVTKGRFKPANDTSMEPALYLHLIAETSEALERATERINQIMQSGASVSAKVYVGIEPLAEPRFPLIGKLLGQKAAFVKHIANETSTKVQLKGRGSGYVEAPAQTEAPEPLFLHIIGATPKSVADAKALAENLISHVKQEYTEFLAAKNTTTLSMLNSPLAGYPGYPPGAYPSYGVPPINYALAQQGFPLAGAYPNQFLPYGFASQAPSQAQSVVPPQAPPKQFPPHPSYNAINTPNAQPSIPQQPSQYPPPQSYYPQQPHQPHQPQQGGSDRFDPRNPRFNPHDANFQQYAQYPTEPQQYPYEQPAQSEEPAQKRRFSEKKEAPAVGPQLPSAEEMAAYTLPEPSDLMPPPPVPVSRRPPLSSEAVADKANYVDKKPAKKNSALKLVDYDPEAEADEPEPSPSSTSRVSFALTNDREDADDGDYASIYLKKKQKQQQEKEKQQAQQPKNAPPQKPTPAARPFWALGPESIPLPPSSNQNSNNNNNNNNNSRRSSRDRDRDRDSDRSHDRDRDRDRDRDHDRDRARGRDRDRRDYKHEDEYDDVLDTLGINKKK